MIKSISITSITSITSVILSLFLLSTNASATVIYAQDLDPSLTVGRFVSDFGTTTRRANKFTLSGAATQSINTISWLGTYGSLVTSPGADDFTLRVFADNGSGAPELSASVLDIDVGNAVNRAGTGGFSIFGRDIYTYQASLGTDITLSSGVDYWLAVINDFSVISTSDSWSWAVSSFTGSNTLVQGTDGGTWVVPTTDTAQYELSHVSSVPIPAALWLMISGLAGLATFKRKQHA